jgi:hypothetical protein
VPKTGTAVPRCKTIFDLKMGEVVTTAKANEAGIVNNKKISDLKSRLVECNRGMVL